MVSDKFQVHLYTMYIVNLFYPNFASKFVLVRCVNIIVFTILAINPLQVRTTGPIDILTHQPVKVIKALLIDICRASLIIG